MVKKMSYLVKGEIGMKKHTLEEIQHPVTYRFLGGKPEDGILSCGFMRKVSAQKSQLDFVIPYYSCFVLLDGSGEYQDETGFCAHLTPGCVVQRIPNRIHSTLVNGDGKWLEFYISFGKCVFDSLVSLNLLDDSIPVFHTVNPSIHFPAFYKLLSQMSTVAEHALLPCLSEAEQIAFTLTQHTALPKQKSSVIVHACSILEKDLKKELSLTEVAKQLCLGYETFRKQFYYEMNQSPEQYRQQKRMITAQIMLTEGEPVKSVAKALGYSDAYAFSKQFKRFFGCSPVFLSS